MTLAQLRYAITVANSNSMNEAARNLLYHSPVCPQQSVNWEEEIGVELFAGPTVEFRNPEGEEFLGYARQV